MDVYSQIPKDLKVIDFSGASGTGKGTYSGMLIDFMPDKFSFSVSATTRPKGKKEIEGFNYYFKEVEEFKRMIKREEFVEYNEYRSSNKVATGVFYGTLLSEIIRIHKEGKIAVLDTEINGMLSVKKLFGKNCLSIFLCASEEEREKRIRARGRDSEEDIVRRVKFGTVEQELAKNGTYGSSIDYRIENPNGKQEEVFEEIKNNVLKFLGISESARI